MKNSTVQTRNPFPWAAALAASWCLVSAATASAATDTWTGNVNPNGNWSNGGNWLSGNPPLPADSLVFTNQSGVAATPTNDFAAGTIFDGITFGASAAGSTLTLVGNPILLSGNANGVTVGITNLTALSETVSNNLNLDWGYYMFYSPVTGSSLNLNGGITTSLGAVANFGTNNVVGANNVNSTTYVQDGTGLIAGLGGAGLVGDTGLGTASGGGFSALATISNGVVVAYNSYPANQIYGPAGTPIGVDDTTLLTPGFAITNSTLSAGFAFTNSTLNTGFAFTNSTLALGFANASVVTSVVVNSNAPAIIGGMVFSGTGVPAGVTVSSVAGSTVNVSSFTSTAASGTGVYNFATVVSSVVVNSNALAIVDGMVFTGTGVPTGVTVSSVAGNTVNLSTFTSTAASSTSVYDFAAVVTSVLVNSNANVIVAGDAFTGTGVPAGVTVTGVSGNTISVSNFTATAASSTATYTFSAVVDSLVVSNATGIQLGAVLGGTGVPVGGVMVTNISGNTVMFSNFIASATSSGFYTFASTAADPANIEITTTATADNFTLAGGTSTTYGANQTFINTALLNLTSNTKVTALDIPGSNGTLVLGSTNAGTGMYVGGIYAPGGQGNQIITIGSGASTFLTAGPMSGNPVPGEIIFGINGSTTGNQGEMNCVIKDNLSGGKVSVVYTGGGTLYVNTAGSTYSGGTYMVRGRVQANQITAFGTGPVYIAGGDANISLQNVPAGTVTNNFFLSPASSTAPDTTPNEGALRCTGEAPGGILSGTITLMGNPVTLPLAASPTGNPAVANRISDSTATITNIFSGQITGTGTLEFYAAANNDGFVFSNRTANANNWTGGLIISSVNNDTCWVRLGNNNQLAGNNVETYQAGTGFARLDLNSFNDTIGALMTPSGSTSANNWVGNFGVNGPSTLTLGAGNGTAAFAGVLADNGSPNILTVVKIGSGTQTLSGSSTYSGNTLVAGGTLALTGGGTLANTPQITVSNAIFDVSAASSFTSTANLVLTNGTFNIGNILATVGSLALSNSTLNIPLNQTQAVITISGALTTGGTTNVIDVASVPGFATYPQQVPLVKYSSASPGLTVGNNQLATLGVILPTLGNVQGFLTNNVNNSSIDLVILNGPVPVVPLTWNGKVSGVNNGTWDILRTPAWVVTTNPGEAYDYQDTSVVTFDDTAAGTTSVNVSAKVSPGSVTFNNTNLNYTLSGAGSISGPTALNMIGGGTVVLAQTGGDNYGGGIIVNNPSGTLVIDNNSGGVSGGVTITAGTVQVGNHDANGVLPAGTITDNGALVFNRTDTALTVPVVIAGTGGVTNNGTGTVTISAIATYTGPTVVNAGTLAFTTPNANPSGISTSSALIINAGATVMGTLDNDIGLTAATLPVFINAGGTLTGAATADGGGGTSAHIGSMLTINGGLLTDGGSQTPSLAYGSWDLDGGVTVPGGPITSTIGCLNVVPSQAGGTYFHITNGITPSGIDLLVGGTFINGTTHHDTGVIKDGPGVMALDGNNAYIAGTIINNGTLQLGLPSDSAALNTPLGGGTVTLNTGGILELASSQGVTVTNAISDDQTGVVMVNSGTNFFGGVNTYDGQTFVNAGALILTNMGSINASTNVLVQNATFDVSSMFLPGYDATAAAATLTLSNGKLVLGTNVLAGLNTLALSNATLSVVGNVSALSTTGSGLLAPSITVNSLITGGATNVINVTSVPGFLNYPTNLTLIQYTTAPNLVLPGLILTTNGRPVCYLTNIAASSQIVLVIITNSTPAFSPLTWNGQVNGVNNGTWNFTTRNWVVTGTTMPLNFTNFEGVTFDDTLLGTPNVNLTTLLGPGGITVSNANETYVIRGSGAITNLGGITKVNTGTAIFAETGGDTFYGGVSVGSGTLVLSNLNVNIGGGLTVNGGTLVDQHSGAISGGVTVNNGNDLLLLDQPGAINGNLTINGGTVQVGTNDANGNLPSGAILNNDTLVFDRSDAGLNVASVIGGGGQLINDGTGTVTLSAIETYTGPTIVNAGTLVLNAGNNAAPSGISRSSSLTINTNGTVEVGTDNSLAGHGAGDALAIFINAGGTLTGAPGDDNGDGVSCHLGGLLTLNGGTLANSGTSINAAQGSWDLDGGVATGGGSFTSTMSALDMLDSENGGTQFNVVPGSPSTPSGIDLLVTGSIIHGTAQADGGIIVNGGGVMALDNNNTYTNGTTVNGGTLQLGAANDTAALTTPAGTGPISLDNQGTTLNLAGNVGVTVGNVISDDGQSDTLVVSSSGINFLTASNLYTGSTVVSNGTLVVNGSLAAASVVTVKAPGILGGGGAVYGPVTTAGFIAPGTGLACAMLTCANNVTISGGCTMKLDLSNGTNDMLFVGGTLTYGGTLNVSVLSGAPVPNQTFQLFSATSPIGNFTTFNLPPTEVGQSWIWNPTAGTLKFIQTINPNPTNLTASVSNNVLRLSWPADHTGWLLQMQTNSLSVGLNASSNDWTTVPGSSAMDHTNIPINPAPSAVFYRLVYP